VSLHTGRTMEKLVERNARLARANSVPLLQWDTGTVNEAGRRTRDSVLLPARGEGSICIRNRPRIV
jgi:hypothetical protein